MSSLNSLKNEISELLKENSSDKIAVNKIVENFTKINSDLILFYEELDKISGIKPIEEHKEFENFSLIDKNILEYLEVYIPK